MNEDEIRDLGERTQEIQRITQTLGWDLFVDRAKAEIEKHQNLVLGGRLEEADYHREAGWLQGALAIIGLPDQALKEFQRRRAEFDAQREAEEEEDGVPV